MSWPLPHTGPAATMLLAALWAPGGAAWAQQAPPSPPAANVSVASGVDDLAVLTGPTADDAARFESAKRLVLKTDEATTAGVSAALRGAPAPGSIAAQRAIAKAIAAVDPGSPRYALALRNALSGATDPSCVADLLAALDHYPPRTVVGTAIARLAAEGTPDETRALLNRALLRWTGCDECAAQGASGWAGWWSRAEPLDAAGWQAELAKNFRARSERVEARREALATRVADLYNALYAATPVERRGEVIASMLKDDLRAVNRTGLDLASRMLLNAQRLGDNVASAAVALLSSPDEDIRAGAARLVENLGAPVSAATLTEALTREQSPRAAAPLLRLSSRAGSGVPVATLLRWLRAPEPAGSAAADALLALHAAHALPDDARDDARSTLLGAAPASISVSQARLLGALGGDGARDALRAAADGAAGPGARRAAALALAEDPANADLLIDGAATHPSWFEAAALAVGRHRPAASSFLAVASHAPAEGGWIEPLSKALAKMPSDQRLAALRAIDDLERRDDLLDATVPLVRASSPAEARELLVLQGETRLDRGDADGALAAATGALRDSPTGSSRAEHVRFYALAALGRLTEALAATPGDPVECWLEALRRCASLPHAAQVLALVDDDFTATMTPAQRDTLESLRARIAGGAGAAEDAASALPGPGLASPES